MRTVELTDEEFSLICCAVKDSVEALADDWSPDLDDQVVTNHYYMKFRTLQREKFPAEFCAYKED